MDDQYSIVVEPLLKSFKDEILQLFGNVDHEMKGDKTVVTKLDKSIEIRIREELEKQFPDIGFCGEEYGISGNTEKYWLIDPIDGTQNFIRGLKGVGTILAIVENNHVTYSATYDPIEDVVCIASEGNGVKRNGKKVKVSDRAVQGSFVDVGSSVYGDRYQQIIKLLRSRGIEVISTHGSAERAMNIVSGKIEGYIKDWFGGHVWDKAPGNMMALEAGAIVKYYDGKDPLESTVYSALTPKLQNEIGEELERIMYG